MFVIKIDGFIMRCGKNVDKRISCETPIFKIIKNSKISIEVFEEFVS